MLGGGGGGILLKEEEEHQTGFSPSSYRGRFPPLWGLNPRSLKGGVPAHLYFDDYTERSDGYFWTTSADPS